MKICDTQRILVMDDEPRLVEMYRYLIGAAYPEVHVDVALNGVDGMESFKRCHHGVVILDLSMPVMDGEQVFQAMLTHCAKAEWNMPCAIFCSGYLPPAWMEDVVEASSNNLVLQKPIDSGTMLAGIGRMLEQSRILSSDAKERISCQD